MNAALDGFDPLVVPAPDTGLWLAAHRHLREGSTRVLEIGIGLSGLTAECLAIVGSGRDARVVRVDRSAEFIADGLLGDARLDVVIGSPSDADTVARAAGLIKTCDLLVIGTLGAEAEDQAIAETYMPLLRPGGFVVWHDVQVRAPFGMKGAWEAIASRYHRATKLYLRAFDRRMGVWQKPVHAGVTHHEALAVRSAGVTEVDLEARLAELEGVHDFAAIPAAILATHAAGGVRACKALGLLADGLYRASQCTRNLGRLEAEYRAAFTHLLAAAEPGTDVGPRDDVVLRFVRTLRYESQLEAALSVCEHRLAVGSSCPKVEKERAVILLEIGDLANARHAFRALLAQDPADVEAAYFLVASANADDSVVTDARACVLAMARRSREAMLCQPGDPGFSLGLTARLREFGFVLVRDAFPTGTTDEILAWSLREPRDPTRGFDGRLTPRHRERLWGDMRDRGLATALDRHLGDWSLHKDSYVKVQGFDAGTMAFHQDGRTSNSPRRYATVWLALHDCGLHRAGLEIVSLPFSTFFPAGAVRWPRAAYRWSLDEALLIPETVWAPTFAAGDALIFDKFTAHATQLLPTAVAARHSVDFRVHARA